MPISSFHKVKVNLCVTENKLQRCIWLDAISSLIRYSYSVADPGFPVGGSVDLVGGGGLDSQGGYVSKIPYVKTKESGPLGWGHALGICRYEPLHRIASFFVSFDILSITFLIFWIELPNFAE